MLTPLERLLFLLVASLTLYLTLRAAQRLVRIIARGQGRPDLRVARRRLGEALAKTVTFTPVFRTRWLASLLHGLVAWGFIYYLLVNLGDVLEGYIPGFVFLGEGGLGRLYRLGADLLSLGVLVGMVGLLIRRFLLGSRELQIRPATLVHPKARAGIRRDSAIVGGFILIHVGSRFLGDSFQLAAVGPEPWIPAASWVAGWWAGWGPSTLNLAIHVSWWLALGTILAFFPYFPRSKHIHLIFTPINFLLQPERASMGALDRLDFEDASIEQFGAARLEQLSWKALLDAYSCIMCNRCQDACPAYTTGKTLSPAALEVNKRYFLNAEGSALARGEASSRGLLEFAITAESVWGCTACGACVDICPVGNEPMRDILDIRRHLVLTENTFPEQLQTAYRGMERTANPWNIAPEARLKWAEGLEVKTIAEHPRPEILWWVGCAPATDARAQKTAQAFARLLHRAGVDFAVLGSEERCTGDAARRSGHEFLFNELAQANVETLNRVNPPRIVTTCPHCLHTLKTEYPAFGGHYQVVHHTQLLQELQEQGRLPLEWQAGAQPVTFHDPCFLGRQNGIFESPRASLNQVGIPLYEMPRTRAQSFCCGAGGAQMWKEEEPGNERVSANRVREARATGVSTLAVGCPFCMIMLTDAAGATLDVRDVAELLAEQL
jgi:Fe-S oxidoreductase